MDPSLSPKSITIWWNIRSSSLNQVWNIKGKQGNGLLDPMGQDNRSSDRNLKATASTNYPNWNNPRIFSLQSLLLIAKVKWMQCSNKRDSHSVIEGQITQYNQSHDHRGGRALSCWLPWRNLAALFQSSLYKSPFATWESAEAENPRELSTRSWLAKFAFTPNHQ